MATSKKKAKKPAAKTTAKLKPAAKSKTSAKSATPAAKAVARPSAAKASSKPTGPIGLTPIRSRVIIQKEEGEDRTAGGIIIPDTAKEKPAYGRVLAVGTGAIDKKGRLRPMTLKVGDRVVYNRWSGSQVQLDGRDLLVIEEKEIVGIFED
ncbi:MAG TPA: co-chaperone GroES [Bdellovibrionales bacterium]|nr:co-chaperone GroES [Bdellovibrionales bacterium]